MIAQLKNRRRKILSNDKESKNSSIIKTLLQNSDFSLIILEISLIPIEFLHACCEVTYRKFIEEANAVNRLQFFCDTKVKAPYRKERQFRITGSRCYNLYTYAKNDWNTKVLKYFWPKTFSNKYVEHGMAHEPNARTLFQEITKKRY